MRKLIILFVIFSFTHFSYAEECGHIDFVKYFKKNNNVELKGYYFNPNHCFSVELPQGIIGRHSSGSSSHHGIGIILPKGDGTDYLLIQGDWGAELDEPQNVAASLNQIVTTRLKWIAKKNATILNKDIENTTMGGLPAKHLVVKYQCKKSGTVFLQDSIYTLDNSGSIYEMSLFASPDTYKESSIIYDRIAKTWEIKKCEKKFQQRLK